VDLFGFSDALNKRTFEGTNVGVLSGLTYDARSDVDYGVVDNEGTTDILGPPGTTEDCKMTADSQMLEVRDATDEVSPRRECHP
jgi:hypothetical protein